MFPSVLLNIPRVKVSSRWLWSRHWICLLVTRTNGISTVQNQLRIHLYVSLIMNEENHLFCIISTKVGNFTLRLLFWQVFFPCPLLLSPPSVPIAEDSAPSHHVHRDSRFSIQDNWGGGNLHRGCGKCCWQKRIGSVRGSSYSHLFLL